MQGEAQTFKHRQNKQQLRGKGYKIDINNIMVFICETFNGYRINKSINRLK